MYIRKRLFVVIIAFLAFLLAVSCGFLIIGMRENNTYRTADGYGYQNGIVNLAVSLDKISDSLKKTVYASTPYRTAALGAELLASAESGRAALSSLPTYELMLDKTNEFFDRVGDFSLYLTRRAINGEELTEADKVNLLSLSNTAQALADRVSLIEEETVSGNLDRDAIAAMFDVPDGYWEASAQTAAAGESVIPGNRFLELETLFPGDEFIYDGKYSDHLKNAVSAYLEGSEAVTERQARETAAAVIGCTPEELVLSGDIGTKSVKCYVFSDKTGACSAYVTKQGGRLWSYSCGETAPADVTLSSGDAEAKAVAFLAGCGYSGLTKAYWRYQDNMLLLTYVTEKNGVRIYPEKISVGVSLSDGKIIFCDASGYLSSYNTSRKAESIAFSEAEAVASLPESLTAESVNLAYILSQGQKELLCHEIYCRSEDGTRLVVYINAANGAEEDSLLLTDNEEGFSAR